MDTQLTSLTEAWQWHELGIAVLPIRPHSKQPLLAWKQYQSRLPSTNDIIRWFLGTDNNIAIVTGWEGLTVLDFDRSAQYKQWASDYPLFAQTYTVATARGVHCYFFAEKPMGTRLHLDGVDIKGVGGYVLAPPSIHPSGSLYAVIKDTGILLVESMEEIVCNFPHYKSEPTEWLTIPAPIPTELTGQHPVSIHYLKSRLSMLELACRYTEAVSSSADGRWWTARCPMPGHLDRRSSFWIDSARNLCGCQVSSCQAQQPGGRPMDVLNFYSRLHGVDSVSALRSMSAEIIK